MCIERWAIAGLLVVSSALCRAQTVAYFTDSNAGTTAPATAITSAGFTPLQISDIATFNFVAAPMLLINESNNNGLTRDLTKRMGDILAYVQNGGKLIVHDRFVASLDNVPASSPFLVGRPNIQVQRDFTNNDAIDFVNTATNPVANGPAGKLNNSSLDGGNSSSHGFIFAGTEPTGAVNIAFRDGEPNRIVAFDYTMGKGFVYYSTIPLDHFLDGSGNIPAFANPYAPNALSYVNSLSAAVPEPGSVALLVGAGLTGAVFARRRLRSA